MRPYKSKVDGRSQQNNCFTSNFWYRAGRTIDNPPEFFYSFFTKLPFVSMCGYNLGRKRENDPESETCWKKFPCAE